MISGRVGATFVLLGFFAAAAFNIFVKSGVGSVAGLVEAKLNITPISAADFGARCDGNIADDDTAAIQAAIEQAQASSTKAVTIPGAVSAWAAQ